MVERLKQFLVDEFNLTFEEACKMSLSEAEVRELASKLTA